jgi:hypothetical protein
LNSARTFAASCGSEIRERPGGRTEETNWKRKKEERCLTRTLNGQWTVRKANTDIKPTFREGKGGVLLARHVIPKAKFRLGGKAGASSAVPNAIGRPKNKNLEK